MCPASCSLSAQRGASEPDDYDTITIEQGDACPEGVNARKARRLKQTDIEEVEGLKLGRFPFTAAATRYMERRYGTVAKSTFEEETRKYAMLGRMLEALKEAGKLKSTDPRSLSRRDVQEFMAMMREKELDSSAQARYLQLLNNLLKAFKNFVLEEMKAEGVRFPKIGRKPIRVISENDLQAIFETTEGMDGWRGSVSRGVVALFFATGIRPSEARLARLDDLNLEKRTFFVRHPKGEGSWASPSEVEIIREDMLPFLKRYKHERAEWLGKNGRSEIVALFPCLESETGFYTANGLRLIKAKVEKLSRVNFKLKDFRSTLTSVTVNGDMSRLPAMSAQLRHASMTTTQRSYYAMERGVAGRQLKDAWREHPIKMHDTPLIELKERLPGYG